jgi:alpha-tubulin suppressor-like RCC1 family protein
VQGTDPPRLSLRRTTGHRRRPPVAGLLLAALAGACGGGSSNAPDAAVPADASSPAGDRPTELAPADRAPAVACTRHADCPADHFCGPARGRCVSAVAQVVAGAHHGCALHRDGRVSCWGLAESISGGGDTIVAPTEVEGAAGATALAAGKHVTCAITGDRTVRCWGSRTVTVARENGAPLAGVSAIAVGAGFACAANGEGVHCWGSNVRGQLARPLTVDTSEAALQALPGGQRFLGAGEAAMVHDGAGRICAWGDNLTKLITASDDVTLYTSPQCAPLPDVVQLVVGSVHACVRHAAGTFSCWGERYYGALGIGGTDLDTADIGPFGTATTLAAPVTTLVAGTSHTCALSGSGAVECFGLNSLGQVGPNPGGPQEEIRRPVPVSGFAGRVVGLGSGSSGQHTCALLEDGQVQCWGSNHAGQLGDGPRGLDPARFSPSPVSVRW